MPHSLRLSFLQSCALVVLAMAAGCSSPTAPEPMSVSLNVVPLKTAQDAQAWPFTPTISGGSTIEIRGMALAGCGNLQASATRRGADIIARITSENTDQLCLATTPAWQAFSAVIQVPPGEYDVQTSTVGQEGEAHFAASVQ